MKSGRKGLLAFLAFAPWLFIFATSFLMVFGLPRQLDVTNPSIPADLLMGIGILFGAAVILTFLGLIFFVVHLATDNRPEARKGFIIWIFVLLLFGNVGQTIYFFARVRKHTPPSHVG